MTPRPIDHLVLPTADLGVARARLTKLGFTVAPDGLHPFGTANCCAYLPDGTFLEPLAVADPTKAEIAAMRGNVFVARDRAWRYRRGEEGFSAVVFGTADADADHQEFVRAGISAGDELAFSRPFLDASGRKDTASFKLAFAADLRAPDAFFFTCERVNAPAVDRSALQGHENGVQRIKAIILEAPKPSDFAAFLQEVVCVRATRDEAGLTFAASNGEVRVRGRAVDERPNPGLLLTGVVFGVEGLDKVATLLQAGGVDHTTGDERIVVAAGPGQGAEFIFEEF
jgi:hypothetical protein